MRVAAASMAGGLHATASENVLLSVVGDKSLGGKTRAAALRALGTMESAKLSQAVKAKPQAESLSREALAAALRAQELDPQNTLPYLWGSSLWRALAERLSR